MHIMRCIWGDFSEGSGLSRCWADIKKAASQGEQELCTVYCYGEDNAKTLKSMHFNVVQLNKDPYPDGKRDYDNGRTMVRPWHYKFQMIHAVSQTQPVIYCDFDVRISHNTAWPSYEKLFHDRNVLLSLYKYKRPRGTKIPRADRRAKCLTPSGNWIYVANDLFPEAVLRMMDTSPDDDYASWHDEYAMNDVIDQTNGGWPGEETWLEMYESPMMIQKGGRRPWPDAETPVPFEWHREFWQ